MITIKFRGLRTDGKGWVVGQLAYFFDNPKNTMIMPTCYFGTRDFGEEDENDNPIIQDEIALGGFINVNPETVSQFTGLLDKNGVEIYESDILDNGKLVYWSDEQACYFCGDNPLCMSNSHRAIIGNLHEHKQLLV